MEVQGSKGVFVGGASGMCRATATRLVERGGKAAIVDLEKSNGAAVAEELGGKFFPCNVMDFEAMVAVMGEAVDYLGGLHFMINTAGGGVAQRTLTRRFPGAWVGPMSTPPWTLPYSSVPG